MRPETAPELRDRVQRLIADPGYAELLVQLRARIEAGGQPSSVTLRGLGDPARRALADLLGRRQTPAARVRVSVDAVDQALRASRVQAGLVRVLEAMAGPMVDQRAARASERDRWAGLWAELEARPDVQSRDGLRVWLAGLRADGLLVRLADDVEAGRRLMEQALSVVAELPAGGRSLPVVAAACTGDPHALDHGTALATLVLRAAVILAGKTGLPSSRAMRRGIWGDVGVVWDPLSTHVLVLNLPSKGTGLLARTLDLHAQAGEPLRLTLRALERHECALQTDVLYVCENPAVLLAAADVLGAACAPLVCTEGMPGVAVGHLLAVAADAGAALRFHTDFDWGGMRIGNFLVSRHDVAPWRMAASDYEAGLAAAGKTSTLRGRLVDPAWDPALAHAMQQAGRVVSEEHVLDILLSDLA